MKKVRVSFVVRPNRPCEELYLIGSTKNIGEWNTTKAAKMRFDEELNAFVINKLFVEKGIWNEEICNRVLVPTKGLKLNLTIEHI